MTNTRPICKHVKEVEYCACGVKFMKCPICEPRMFECVNCTEDRKAVTAKRRLPPDQGHRPILPHTGVVNEHQ